MKWNELIHIMATFHNHFTHWELRKITRLKNHNLSTRMTSIFYCHRAIHNEFDTVFNDKFDSTSICNMNFFQIYFEMKLNCLIMSYSKQRTLKTCNRKVEISTWYGPKNNDEIDRILSIHIIIVHSKSIILLSTNDMK